MTTDHESAIPATGIPIGGCGYEPCDAPALYEVRFRGWGHLRSGVCAAHAPIVRTLDNVERIWLIEAAR